jgi:hypothetical protein
MSWDKASVTSAARGNTEELENGFLIGHDGDPRLNQRI